MNSQYLAGRKVMLRMQRTGCCTMCKHLTRRTTSVWQYLTPLNRNAAGDQKTEKEVLVELNAELERLKTKPHVCRSCEKPRSP